MNIKSYTFENVNFGYSLQSKKWEFKTPDNFTVLLPAPGGQATAHKLAKIINGAVKRSGGYDGLARRNAHLLIDKMSGE